MFLDITEANSHQIIRRAKQHLSTNDRSRTAIDSAEADRIAEEFLAASLSGDVGLLVRLLTDDAVSVADGGGRLPARKSPVTGASAIARYLRGLFRPTDARRIAAGGSPAIYLTVANGRRPSWLRSVSRSSHSSVSKRAAKASRRFTSRSTRTS
jgi:hypothetical protein